MNIDSVLLAIESFRSTIENWGISSEGLWIAGGLAALLFIVSLREVLTWFLKIQSLAEDLRSLRMEVRDLKQFMQVAREVTEIAEKNQTLGVERVAAPAMPVAANEEAPVKRFPFDH